MSEFTTVTIYTDGSTWPKNPGPGGWGAAMFFKDRVRYVSGSYEHATNNQMEVAAVIHSLKLLKRRCTVFLFTDSRYVITGIKHLQKGRMHKTNPEFWNELKPLIKAHTVYPRKVEAHSKDKNNDIADLIARQAAQNQSGVDFYATAQAEQGRPESRVTVTA